MGLFIRNIGVTFDVCLCWRGREGTPSYCSHLTEYILLLLFYIFVFIFRALYSTSIKYFTFILLLPPTQQISNANSGMLIFDSCYLFQFKLALFMGFLLLSLNLVIVIFLNFPFGELRKKGKIFVSMVREILLELSTMVNIYFRV